MELSESMQEIEELFGREWLNRCIKSKSKLSLEERIDYARNKAVPNKSFFCRDKPTMGVLKHAILLRFKKSNIHIASVGCSTGEEVYSIIADNWEIRKSLFIDGYDIDSSLLEKAKEAVYPYDSHREELFQYNLEKKAFTKSLEDRGVLSSYYSIRMTDEAKKHVRFMQYDIVKIPLPEKYDLIMIGNVLCHYSDKGREIIIKNAIKSINKSGFMLFESESVGVKGERKEYLIFMENLSRFGIRKQRFIPTEKYEDQDSVRVYRKK